MKKTTFVASLMLLLSLLPALAGSSADTTRYIVRLKSPTTMKQSYIQKGQAIVEPEQLARVRAALKRSLEQDLQVKPVRELFLVPALVLDLTEAQAQQLENHAMVAYVEPTTTAYLFSYDYPPTPNPDADEVEDWGLSAIRAQQVWSQTRGAGVKVGVIDSGIDFNHEDLMANYAGGTDIINNDSTPEDSIGHGTHVSGIIGAPDNGKGVVGVAPEVELYAIKTFNGPSLSDVSIIAEAIEWGVTNGLDVLNLSLGMRNGVTSIEEACQAAYDAGVAVIAATGNDSSPYFVSYPAAYSTTLAVGSVNAEWGISAFSNRGPQVSVVAPGDPVLSTYPEGTGFWTELHVDGTEYESFVINSVPFATRSGEAVLVPGVGTPEDFALVDVQGKVAIVERGEIPFIDKGANAHVAGAVAMVVYQQADSADELPSGWSYSGEGNVPPLSQNVPALGVRHEAGPALAGHQVIVVARSSNYSSQIGTSMATPHAAGAAALLLALDGGLSAQAVYDALTGTAIDLGNAGRDNTYGYGIIDVRAAADLVSGSCGAPAAAFDLSSSDRTVTVDASTSAGCNLSYSWDFGDGSSASGASATHTYASDGTYTITLTISDDQGLTDSSSQSVSVSQCALPVVADFSASANLLVVSLDASTSSGCGLSYSWDLGDGSTSTQASLVHTYAVEGDYTVTLVVTDQYGVTASDSQVVGVVDCDTVTQAAFTYSAENKSVSLNASASTGCGITYAWDLGDGSTASGVAPSHTYAAAGDYLVTLTVTDEDGGSNQVSQTVNVPGCAAPVAAFSVQASLLSVTLDASGSTGCSLSYAWDLGDGNSASGTTVSHTYADGGVYTITLTVTDEDGQVDSSSTQVQVSGPAQCVEIFNKQPLLISGLTGDALCFITDIHPDALLPTIKTYGGTGDVDLYVAQGRPATVDDYDYKNTGSGTDESIRIWERDLGGVWYITVLGVADFQGVSVEIRYNVY